MEGEGRVSLQEAIEQALSQAFAWSWVVAYRSARVHAARDKRRYWVFREKDDRSPTGSRWTWRVMGENPCPRCRAETKWEPECPTYRRGDGPWMRCTPVCGNASAYTCTNDECEWEYLDGVSWDNPNYGRYRHLQGERPDWLIEAVAA